MNLNVRRVIFVVHSLGGGGAEKQLLSIAHRLGQMGLSIDIVPLVAKVSNDTVDKLRGRLPDGVVVWRPLSESLSGLKKFLSLSREDVVWSWGVRADFVAFPLAMLVTQARWFVSIRHSGPQLPKLAVLLYRLAARRISALVGNSQAGLNLVQWRVQGLRKKGVVIRNFVNPVGETWRRDSRDVPRVVMLGNVLINTKGYDVLVSVARLLQEEFPVEFLVGGRGDELGEFMRLIDEQGVTSIRYVGEVANVGKYLADADAYMLLSRNEGCPNSLLEAISVGVPVIATRVGDLESMFEHKQHLLLVAPDSPEEAADAIREILRHPEAADNRAVLAKARLEELFSETATLKQLCSLLGVTPAAGTERSESLPCVE